MRSKTVYCPDHDNHPATEVDIINLLIKLHGDDISIWPRNVPEVLKINAERQLLRTQESAKR